MLRSNKSTTSSIASSYSRGSRGRESFLSDDMSMSEKSWDPIAEAWAKYRGVFTSQHTLRSISTLAMLCFAFVVLYNLASSGMNYESKEKKMPSLNLRQGTVSVDEGGLTGLYADQDQQEQELMITDVQKQTMLSSESSQEQEQQGVQSGGMLMSQQAVAMDAGLVPATLGETEATGEFDEVYDVPFDEGNEEQELTEGDEQEQIILPVEEVAEAGDQAVAEGVDGSEAVAVEDPAAAVVAEGVDGSEAVAVEDPAAAEATVVQDAPASEATGNPDLSLDNLSNYKDSWDPLEPLDNPVFWHIPKAGGSTVKDIIGTCHRFVMATEFGVTDGHGADTEIAVVYPASGAAGQDRSPFVNVDTTTVAGIGRAKQMGFADSGLADAIVTPFIYEADELFTPTAKGRLFTVFRHPIDRAISLFYYIQVADWEPTYSPELANWSIEDYAKSTIIENNWMTRQLSHTLEGDLNDDHLKIAMEVIRRKFLVGLMTQIERTMERFERFFHWTYHVNPPNQEACRERLLTGGSNKNDSGNKKVKPEEGSEAYELLKWQNLYDLQLYEYIESLFEEQEQFVAGVPEGFRNIDATCCKCDPPTYPPEGFTCPLAVQN